MLDAKLYCVYFFWYFISCTRKKKLLYFALLWTASHEAFLNLLLCQFTLFLSYLLFLPRGKTTSRQSSLLDIDWNIYSAHAFASLMYTNWFISNQKLSSTLYTWSAFVSQSVCAGAFGFIVVVNSFVVGLFLFLNLSLFVTVWKSAHVMVLLWIWRAVWKDQLAWRLHLKIKPIYFSSTFSCLCMTHNQVEIQHAEQKCA